MRIQNLIETEQEVIPPSEQSDDAEYELSNRILDLETQYKQAIFRAYQQSGIDMTSDEDDLPVLVNFNRDTGMLEVTVWVTFEFAMAGLIKLSEAGLVDPKTMISGDNGRVQIERQIPAANTPFRQFMNLNVSTEFSGGASSS